jgi:phage recombination protein Bet
VTKSTALATLSSKLADRFGMSGGDAEVVDILRNTAFKNKDGVSDAQVAALMVVANEYGLNPFTKEIYAYPDQYKGIVPVVGVDGWIRIINEHPQFDGLEFDSDPEFVTCRVYRKDRSRPTQVTEFLAECKRGTDPWKNMPRRMLRHKALIQCARVAFGFALYDDEEGAVAAGMMIDAATGEVIEPRGPRRKSEAAPAPATVIDGAAAEVAGEQTAPTTPAAAKAQAAQATTGGISGGQAAYLKNKLKAAGLEEQAICDRFQVASIELLNTEQFDTVKAELLQMA